MNHIKIGSVYLKENDNYVKLCADISSNLDGIEVDKTYFYEVEKKWRKYLVTETSDAFVVGLINLAMDYNANIEFTVPISEDLKYQLETYYIPVMANHYSFKSLIRLIGNCIIPDFDTQNAVGTGFSGGVDSFYSVLKHLESSYASKKLTHVILAVNGAAGTGMTKNMDKEWYDEECHRFKPIVEEMGLEFVGINSNMVEFQQRLKAMKGGSLIVTAGFVFALNKLFSTYYWASTYGASVMKFDMEDPGFFEPFTVPLVTTSKLRFYHSGSETNRIGKVKYIADNKFAQKTLTVCGNTNNCGICFKCLRTMAELYAIGKLDNFSEVFPVAEYKKHLSSRFARELAVDHPPFTTEIMDELKRNGIKIPLSIYAKKQFLYKPYYFLKSRLRKNKLAMKIYYGYGWDNKYEGVTHSQEYIEARMDGRI